jgi:Dual-action HEIGH metallo-peptidase
MKKIIRTAFALSLTGLLFIACSKKQNSVEVQPEGVVSEAVMSKIKAAGFNTEHVVKTDAGYIVENDILLTEEDLNSTPTSPTLRIANDEQYRTQNIVTGLPRVIKVKVTGLGTAFIQGADLAISRYNAANLQLTFQRITSGTANINIVGFNQGPSGGFITLGSAGFPTSSGNPYSQISMNTNSAAYGTNPNVQYVGSVIQHEIGHCIGMRHTDYFNRSISCGSGGNEGLYNGSVFIGAVLIPGTPSGATLSAGSWMLACSNGGNRTFNSNDLIALNYLY